MKHSYFAIIIISIISFQMSLNAQLQSESAQNPPHIVIRVEGTPTVSRGETSIAKLLAGESPISVGTLVWSDDTINVDAASTVYILCSNLEIDIISVTPSFPGCSEDVPAPVFAWGRLELELPNLRDAGNSNYLYIVSPRNTLIYDNTPLIQWSGIPEASTYTISVRLRDRTLLWQTPGITDTFFEWWQNNSMNALDGAGNPLEYRISVTAHDENGIEINTDFYPYRAGLLRVVSPEDRLRIDHELNVVRERLSEEVDDPIRLYTEAMFFYSSGLFADAHQTLSQLLPVPLDMPLASGQVNIDSIGTSPYLYDLLGKIYVKTDLPIEAVMAYERTFEVGEIRNDIAMQAFASYRLARLTERSESIGHYQRAILLYTQLGADSIVEQLEVELAEASE